MTAETTLSVGDRIGQLFQHLGIERAHIAASVAEDISELLRMQADFISSLMLVSPANFEPVVVSSVESRLLCVASEHGAIARRVDEGMLRLPSATHVTLKDYHAVRWSDIAAERTEALTSAVEAFLEQLDPQGLPHEVHLPEGQGEVAGIMYEVRGSGPPLILFPLDLSPSQWEPLIPRLSQRYSTITLGGAHLGMVSRLESRAHTGYRPVVRHLFDELQLQSDDHVLDVGCGSGAHDRYLATRMNGANPIMAIDHSPYMIRAARDLARSADLGDAVDFQEGNAEALPFPDHHFDVVFSVTVMEEVNADKMLSEMVRVTKPGGRVGVLVRSVDMPWYINLPLPPALKTRLETPGKLGAGMSEGGCADMSLYTRFMRSGLIQLTMQPQLTAFHSGPHFDTWRGQIRSELSEEETETWRAAVEQAAETFFIALPFHCAIGTKP